MGFDLGGKFSLKEFLTPWWVLWYLMSLIYWRIILQIIPGKILSKPAFIILTLLVSLLVGFLPFNRFLSLQRTFAFMPFFFIGYYFRDKKLFFLSKHKILCASFLALTLIIPIFYRPFLGDLNQADPYNNPLGLLNRLLVWGLSIPMSIAFINICPNTLWTAKQGKLTLQYYIYHAILIRVLIYFIVKYNLPTSFFAATIYTIVIVVGLGLSSKLPFFTKITRPTLLLKLKK